MEELQSALRIDSVRGTLAAGMVQELAVLRLSIFREFPYLYQGCLEDELGYLGHYAEVADSIVVSVTDSGRVVGAATGIPLSHESRALVDPFAVTPYVVEEIYYVGELLFYPEYRNRGLGMRLLTQIEQQVRALGNYRYLVCATIVRPDDHPSRPEGYLPIERFLNRAGFILLPGITTSFAWRETDGSTREHEMKFWIKNLTPP
jgi:GNAT superfamily N-acetyltransferase